MKRLPLILNVVLIIAVAVLYVFHFTGNKSNTTETSDESISTVGKPTGNIVYINIDSVYSNYKMYEDVMKDLQSKANTSEAQLQSRQRAFQKNYQDAQYKAERGLATRAELAQIEQNLGKEQQELMNLQQQLQYQLAEEEQVAQRKVLNSIMEYLKQVENEQAYQFVLGTTFGGNILYANENLDISKKVIEGLNAEYAKSLTKSE
jgi:outer membrane protein